jgi:hypothetical protein
MDFRYDPAGVACNSRGNAPGMIATLSWSAIVNLDPEALPSQLHVIAFGVKKPLHPS